MQETIQQIRKQLRLAMNGVVSSSMREKGMDYKMNFGVSVPKIKEIASQYQPNEELASLMWVQDVRELKIMATLLFPVDLFTLDVAERWVREIKHLEISEQLAANLLPKLSFAEELAARFITDEEEFVSVTGYLLFARLCSLGKSLQEVHVNLLLDEAYKVLNKGLSRKQRAASLALKRFGRQSAEQGTAVLNAIAEFKNSESPERTEIYNDIKFEFEYYE